MGQHVPPLSKRRGNIIFGADGSVTCNYLLTGINVNSSRPETATAAQDSHQLLFNALSQIPTDDIALHGIKVRVDPMQTFQRMTRGVPDWDVKRYRYLDKLLNDFHDRMISGEFAEYARVYWLAISQPSRRSMAERIAATMIETDPHEGLDWTDLGDFEKKCRAAIPSEFHAVRTTPEMVDWVFDRATTRGLPVPMLPAPPSAGSEPAMVPGERSYPEVAFDLAAESTALYRTFVADLDAGRDYARNLTKAERFRALSRRFRTLKSGKIMAISHPGRRSASMPDGPTSYQSMLAIARYPKRPTIEVSDFTYMVDCALDVDADFTLRMRFDQGLIATSAVSDAENALVAEGQANAEDEFEADDYDERRAELRRFHRAVRDESGPIGMQVSAIFAFGSSNLDKLNARMAAITQKFSSKGYTTLTPVGGQKELWTMMMPGSVRTRLGSDMLQTTTARQFSGAMPIRRSFVGDTYGMPIAVNRENALGQIVLLNLITATDRGNGSIALTGAQGSGKSNLMKLLYWYVTALNLYGTAIDHSEHGEWAVYSRQLARTQVINAATGSTPTGTVSMDFLKCLPSPAAENMFMAHYLPLMGFGTRSDEAAYLARALRPDFRARSGITSTRSLISWLKARGDREAVAILRELNHWADLPYTGAFIDREPRSHGDPGLPPFDNLADLAARVDAGDAPYATVFRTHELPVYRGSNPDKATDHQKWSAAVYASIARITAYRFSQIRRACVFFADEISFFKGNEDVVELMIRAPDRVARKSANYIVTASQHADDFDENYTMIEKKAALRQKVPENARPALKHVGLPVLDSLVDMMVTQTSPPDPDNENLTRAGRYGEGWWNDGNNNIARVQFLPILSTELARFADTTSSKMIRESDLDAHPGRESA
ncbi:MAG: AAA family ATPase [Gordonia amarae]